ncbi:hypothetical protein [Clostridium uliginosum]|uniref:Uncharacterized protein n=1 Tax=Clostridium uliginosum TaxID=119641 RepID=A0A1I1P616_9CLOT|nr:hypothetical protein [Clostridium uliginosum]SFD05165.1 hypothetical protein SAMN05421842_11814 [Clostridium uliginosum]
MKNKIIAVLAITCIITSFNLIGCTEKKNETSQGVVKTTQEKQETAEEYVEKMYKGLIDKKLTYENLWEDYFSKTSKNIDMLNKKTYVSNAEANDFKNNIVRTDIKIVSSEEVKEGIFKVKSILKYTVNGKENSEDLIEYVIKENNELKYLPQGIMSVEKHMNTTINNINYQNVNVVNYVEGIGISTDMVNQSESGIALGWADGPTVILKTDKGEYSYKLNTTKVGIGQTKNISIYFDKAEGTPQEVVINNINYLGNTGLPKDYTGGQTQNIVIK